MNAALQKVLADLDGLGEKAIQKRILGVGDEPVPAPESPAEEMAEGEPHTEPDGDELSPELLEKLKALLAAE